MAALSKQTSKKLNFETQTLKQQLPLKLGLGGAPPGLSNLNSEAAPAGPGALARARPSLGPAFPPTALSVIGLPQAAVVGTSKYFTSFKDSSYDTSTTLVG